MCFQIGLNRLRLQDPQGVEKLKHPQWIQRAIVVFPIENCCSFGVLSERPNLGQQVLERFRLQVLAVLGGWHQAVVTCNRQNCAGRFSVFFNVGIPDEMERVIQLEWRTRHLAEDVGATVGDDKTLACLKNDKPWPEALGQQLSHYCCRWPEVF